MILSIPYNVAISRIISDVKANDKPQQTSEIPDIRFTRNYPISQTDRHGASNA